MAVVASLLISTVAFADEVEVDGDNATPVAPNPLAFGAEICLNSTPSKSVLLVVRATGHSGIGNNVFANGTTITWTPTTSAGLTATTVQSITPTNWTSQANQSLGAQTASSVTLTTAITGTLGAFSGTVSYQATGARASDGDSLSRNTVAIAVTGTVINCDDDPPILSLPDNITAEATSAAGAVVAYTATASDADPTNPDVTCAPASGSSFALGTTTINCSAEDAAGNVATGSFTVTVQDTTAPVLSGTPVDFTLEATGAGTIATFTSPTATDAVGPPNPAVTCTPASGSSFALGATTVSCSAFDYSGNQATSSFTITITDTTAPVLFLPDTVTAEATGPSGASVSYTASASDLVDGPTSPSCTPTSGSTFALGTTTVGCSATDLSGNEATGSFSVVVVDTTAPVISDTLENMTLEATGPSGAVASWTDPTASDLVSGSVVVTCVAGSLGNGDTFPLGVTTVTCTATDDAGNSASDDFTVTVQDTTPPSLSVPADQVVEATSAAGAITTFNVTATDAVDPSPLVSCDADSGDTFPLGATLVSCTATDVSGNEANGSFTITVVDTTPPVVTPPSDIMAEATGPSGAAVIYTNASALDIVDGLLATSCDPASGSTFGPGATTVTCSATDSAGNTGTAAFIITVVDTTAPVISVPANITVPGTSLSGATVSYIASASDVVDGIFAPTCSPVSGATFGYGTTTVNCSATDNAGNSATASFTVTVTFGRFGFYSPVDMGGTLNLIKGGQTVPLKFEVFAGPTEVTSTSLVGYFRYKEVTCGSIDIAGQDDIELVTSGNTVLRYDGTGGQFIQNWQTPKTTGKCYVATVGLTDGTTISAYFKTK